jgi:hypothetical protein
MLTAGLLGLILLGVEIFLARQFFSGVEENSATVDGKSSLEESFTPGYVVAKDNSGKLSVERPSEWSDVDGTTCDFRGRKIRLGMIASTDLDAWYRYYRYHFSNGAKGSPNGFQDVSGVFFGASEKPVQN